MGRTCSTHGGEEECIQSFGGETIREETIRRRWEDNIKMDFIEIRWDGTDWIHLA
jgi:hypothetical protein